MTRASESWARIAGQFAISAARPAIVGATRAHRRRQMTATHAQIVDLLGDVDELFVKRLEDTGASLDEIGQALGDLEDESRLGEGPRIPTSSRVAEVRAILQELFDDDDESGYRDF